MASYFDAKWIILNFQLLLISISIRMKEGKLYSQVLQARETFERPVPQLSDVIVVQ